ncbi:MAG TPA: hypothetical protein VKH41_01960 [Myxococcota bacterium]|nr:hypothetical protein [Myxococcota bacterium]
MSDGDVLDFAKLEAIDTDWFRARTPYPFVNPEALIRPEAWERLEAELPTLDQFDQKFGKERRAGQAPHDRYSLEFREGVRVSPAWRTFIDELRSDRYRANVCRLYGVKDVEFRFHWHYTPRGRAVSPHVDQEREFGSHIFYFNAKRWQDDWGGHTLLLGDARGFHRDSAPASADFAEVVRAECVGNRSLLFRSGSLGWHAVDAIECPEDEMRRVFIVVINTTALYWRIRDWVIGKKPERY